VDPAAWRRRTDFKISVGFAAGNKDAMVQRLMLILQTQEKAMSGGLSIVNEQNIYETVLELTKAADFSSPDRFWTNPQGVQKPPPPPNPIIEAEKIKSETTVVTTKAEIDKDLRTNAEKLMLEKYKVDTDAEVKLTIAREQMQHSSVMQEQQTVADFAKADRQHAAGKDMAMHNTLLDPDKHAKINEIVTMPSMLEDAERKIVEAEQQQTQIILQALERLGQQLSAPRELVRDKDGRPIGSRVVT
jgi:hypothetical protein